MKHVGCHLWAGPGLDDIEAAALQHHDAPEVWVPTTHPHLADVVRLWPHATIRTVGAQAPTLPTPYAVHHDGDPDRLDLLTLERPRRTVVLPR